MNKLSPVKEEVIPEKNKSPPLVQKPKSKSPKPKKPILKKPTDEKKPKKSVLFSDFIEKAEAHSKDHYDRKPAPKVEVTKENIKQLKKELNELMGSLYIHPESKKYTKKY